MFPALVEQLRSDLSNFEVITEIVRDSQAHSIER